MKHRMRLLSILVLAACQNSGAPAPKDPALRDIQRATRIELYALDPAGIDTRAEDAPPLANEDVFHGYAILGRAELVDAAQRAALIGQLQHGLDENDDTMAMCFDPRHGLRAELDGRAVELVICFECLQAKIVDPSATPQSRIEPIANSIEPEVSRLYRSLGLTIAK